MTTQLKNYAKVFFITLPLLIAFDMSWVGVIAGQFYDTYLGHLLAETYNVYAIIVFYLFYTIAVLYFAVLPALRQNSFVTAFIQGSALGFVCYTFYDLTNMATLTDWPLFVTVLDIAWGTIMTACVASLTYILATKLYGVNGESTPTP